jgi:hypothetical protein
MIETDWVVRDVGPDEEMPHWDCEDSDEAGAGAEEDGQ